MKKTLKNLLTAVMVLLMTFSSAVLVFAAEPGKITALKSYRIDDDEINLKWNKVKGADRYQIKVYENGKWKLVGTTAGLSYEVDNLLSAKEYKFKVRAYDKKGSKRYYGPYSSVLTAATEPDEVDNLSVPSKTKTTATLTWKEEKRATGYQVYVYSSSKGKYVKKASVKTEKAVIKELKAGRTYKFKVRAYFKTASDVYYGDFSDAVSVKTKASAASSSSGNSSSVTAEKAAEIALKHAGLSKSQVRDFSCKYDWEDGVAIYEVEFEYKNYDYEYDISAASGKILYSEKDRD